MAMAVERSDHIATAMQIEDCLVRSRVRRRGPFRLDAARVYLFHRDVRRKRKGFALCVVLAAPLRDFGGTRAACDLRPEGGDFRIGHSAFPPAPRVPVWWKRSTPTAR